MHAPRSLIIVSKIVKVQSQCVRVKLFGGNQSSLIVGTTHQD
jgi:hypothetical protein